jgi:hypothetical protein
MNDRPAETFYHVTVILDMEYTADTEEHAQLLAANHLSTSLRLGPILSRRIKTRAIGSQPSRLHTDDRG